MRKKQALTLILHKPEAAQEEAALCRRVAAAHADAVLRQLRSLNCSEKQKSALLDMLILRITQHSREQDP